MSRGISRSIEEIREWLIQNIADRLEVEPEELDLEEPITSYGLSSREAIMLSGELEDWIGFSLPPELLYEYPEIDELSEELIRRAKAFQEQNEEDSLATSPLEYGNFLEAVLDQVSKNKEKIVYTFLKNGLDEEENLTYGELDVRAKAIAVKLKELGLEGERALLLYPSGLEYITAFFGCLYAGVTAVPAYPPRKNRGLDRIELIVKDSQAKTALVTQRILSDIKHRFATDSFLKNIHWLITNDISSEKATAWEKPNVKADTLAFLQYTSGSTGSPKGVMISHSNILHNEDYMSRAYGNDASIVAGGWLPIYHDMGLIGQILQAVYLGGRAVFMPPNTFLQNPSKWLEAITKFRINAAAAPNFAYDLCVDKTTEEERLQYDLSSWRVVVNGAEPVRASTVERFNKAFSVSKFGEFCPSFGMAEATLLVTCPTPNQKPTVIYINSEELSQNRVEVVDKFHEHAIGQVGCGTTRKGMEISIVDPDTFLPLQENQVGELWVSGPSVAKGYWNRPEQSHLTFQAFHADSGRGPFMRTGDLGYIHRGELFICGRLKDLIIIRGSNYYPQDIEHTVQTSHPALTNAGGVAFALDVKGKERLVIVQEVERVYVRNLDIEEVCQAIRAAVSENHFLQVHAIQLISPGRLPKTTSGKIQRRATKKAYLDDSLKKLADWRTEESETDITPQKETFEDWVPNIYELIHLAPDQKKQVLKEYFQNLLGHILKIPAKQIQTNTEVVKFGLDSMHAIDIKGRIESDLLYEIQATRFIEGLTIDDLVSELSNELTDAHIPAQEEKREVPSFDNPTNGKVDITQLSADDARELLVDIDSLSAEEVEQLLQKLSEE